MEVIILTVGPVCTNCYIVNKEGSKKCIVIDPGEEAEKIANYIQKREMKLEGILLTHGHFDHITGVPRLLSLLGGKVYAYEEERELLAEPQQNVSAEVGNPLALQPDVFLKNNQKFSLADITFEVIHTPGHTQGSCCYYCREDQLLFSGDTVFMESVGRTDLPTGNSKKLLDSLRNQVLVLPDEVKIYPGHGPETDVAYERANNPYA